MITELLQYTLANIQNTADISVAEQAQLFSLVRSHLDYIINILHTNFGHINEDLKKSYHNQNHIYKMMETHYKALEQ